MNEQKMAQDHPCVIDIIRRQFLRPPSPSNVPYNLLSGQGPNYDPTAGRFQPVLNVLKHKVKATTHFKKQTNISITTK